MEFQRSPESEMPFRLSPELEDWALGKSQRQPVRNTAREVTMAMLITAAIGAIGTGFVLLAWKLLGGWAVFPAIFVQAWVFAYAWARLTD